MSKNFWKYMPCCTIAHTKCASWEYHGNWYQLAHFWSSNCLYRYINLYSSSDSTMSSCVTAQEPLLGIVTLAHVGEGIIVCLCVYVLPQN